MARQTVGWWKNLPQLSRSQVDQTQIQAQERQSTAELDFMKQKFGWSTGMAEEILGMYKKAFGGSGAVSAVPNEYAQNIALFQPGGQFGTGSKMAVDVGTNKGIAAGQMGLAQTGMSSGTNVAGLRANLMQAGEIEKALVDERRIAGLSGALTQSGVAGLTARQIAAQREAEMMRTLSTFG